MLNSGSTNQGARCTCGYLLEELKSNRCPECGNTFTIARCAMPIRGDNLIKVFGALDILLIITLIHRVQAYIFLPSGWSLSLLMIAALLFSGFGLLTGKTWAARLSYIQFPFRLGLAYLSFPFFNYLGRLIWINTPEMYYPFVAFAFALELARLLYTIKWQKNWDKTNRRFSGGYVRIE